LSHVAAPEPSADTIIRRRPIDTIARRCRTETITPRRRIDTITRRRPIDTISRAARVTLTFSVCAVARLAHAGNGNAVRHMVAMVLESTVMAGGRRLGLVIRGE
jgi:hypothetical protein